MVDLNAPIAAVTVYTDRAQVVRRGTLTLDRVGAQDLIIPGLPANIDSNSLRVNGRGTAAVTILGVESKTRQFAETPRQDVRDLEQQLQALQDQYAALSGQNDVLDKRLAAVQQMADTAAGRYARSLARGTVQLEAVQHLLDFLSSQMQQVKQEQAEIAHRQRENEKQQGVLKHQIAQSNTPFQRQDNIVSIPVEVKSTGDFSIELTYVVPGASWQPIYDIRITMRDADVQKQAPANQAQDGKLTLNYLASLTQKTGEDWQEAGITLSTAQPSMGTLPPKLNPLYLDVYSPPPPRYTQAPPAPAPGSAGGGGYASSAMPMAVPPTPPPVPVEAEVLQATVNTAGATVTFNLPRPMNVPSDGQPHRMMVTSHEYTCRLDYSSVPRRASLGYLRATVTNSSTLTLLAGKGNIFRDGEFVGSTNLETIAPEQEFKLFLGPDEQVRTERELTGRDVNKTLIGNTRRNSYAYAIKLENLKAFPVRLSIMDQIPISRNEQIKVRLNHADPQPAEIDNLGIMRWELTLAPRSKLQIHYDYTVEYPRDLRVTGLE